MIDRPLKSARAIAREVRYTRQAIIEEAGRCDLVKPGADREAWFNRLAKLNTDLAYLTELYKKVTGKEYKP